MMRLHKILANTGIGSRRTIESWIKLGRIQVNGKKAVIGQKINVHDKVAVEGKIIALQNDVPQLPRVVLYNKPEGEICSRICEKGKKSVFDSLPPIDGRWVMVGRLDVNTSGLLLFTNQGELAHRLMHPRFEVIRQYAVRVYGEVSDEALNNMRKGIQLSTGLSRFKEIVRRPSKEGTNQWFTVTLAQGKYHEVRELFGSQNYTVSRLIRIKYGSIILPSNLKKGKWVELPGEQVRGLCILRAYK